MRVANLKIKAIAKWIERQIPCVTTSQLLAWNRLWDKIAEPISAQLRDQVRGQLSEVLDPDDNPGD